MKFLKNLMNKMCMAAGILLAVWFLVSWADTLAHNDPVTGDKAYWQGNVIVMLTGWMEEKIW